MAHVVGFTIEDFEKALAEAAGQLGTFGGVAYWVCRNPAAPNGYCVSVGAPGTLVNTKVTTFTSS